MRLPSPLARAAVAGLSLALALALAAGPLLAAPPRRGRATRVDPPRATSAGSFEGTWVRVDSKNKMVVHVRPADEPGDWQIRLLWEFDATVSIDTGWTGRATFDFRGYPGSIVVDVDAERSSEERIVATWRREQQGPRGSLLVETGPLELYRAGEAGRALVWLQEGLRREATVEEPVLPEEAEGRELTTSVMHVFSKQSRRLLAWDEIYW